MVDDDKRLPVSFYQMASGRVPVREWLQELEDEEKLVIGTDLKTVEYGWPLGMPTCEPLGNGLYAVRSHLPTHKIARVMFLIHDGHMVLLHGYIKKSKKIPQNELEIARMRKLDVEDNSNE
jgi:phage-related protein